MQVKKYFEKKVSLLSTSDVRYDGELYTVDPSEQSIALKHVNCMGTEGRRTGDQAIAPSDCTYEFIIFRAVNIRELWLDEGNGRRDLTDEILIPLRSGQSVSTYPKQRQDIYDQVDVPKRKVGYQSRSSQQQGYDTYYQQAAPSRPSYDYGYNTRSGYAHQPAPPQHQYDSQQYAPRPRAPQQTYYDTPNQSNYYYNQQQSRGVAPSSQQYQRGQRGGGYQAPPPQYNQRPQRQQRPQRPPQYTQRPQRQPQYYNQQQQRPPQYYNQGYPQQYGQYNQQRRYSNTRGYNQQRNYGQQRSYNTRSYNTGRGRTNRGGGGGVKYSENQAGTGAFLDNRRLRGDEIDIKDQQDFDFGAAKNEFDLTKQEIVHQVNGGVGVMDIKAVVGVDDKDKEEVVVVDGGGDVAGVGVDVDEVVNVFAVDENNNKPAAGDEEETKQGDGDEDGDDESKKYDKNKSFFDGLETETKKSKPKQDMQTQKDVDTKTFGSVAATYKSRHINRQNQRYGQNRRNNYNRGYNQGYQQNRGRQQQRSYNQYQNNRPQYQRQVAQNQQGYQQGYTTSKWVRR